jgi:uncharacterized protein YdhG (YjbR/CyaY superfamily)
MFTGKAKSVGEYLEQLPPERRAVVSKVRQVVKAHLPKGYRESVNWGVITYEVPLTRLPDTYNGQPLCYAGIAAQKNHFSLYLMCAYGDPKRAKWLADEFEKRGKKLDMGKACVRFKSIDDLPLDVIGEAIASVPLERYVEIYQASRRKAAAR